VRPKEAPAEGRRPDRGRPGRIDDNAGETAAVRVGYYFAAAFWVARVAALATAFREAVTMSLSMPTP